MGRPAAIKVLVGLEAFFAFVGFASGYGFLSDPSGEGMGLTLDYLEDAPVGDYMLVGMFFVAFYGFLPAIAAYGLWTRRKWAWTDFINRRTGQHWAWTASLELGIILLLWILVEVIFVGVLTGIGLALQVIIVVFGVAVLGMVMLPSVRADLRFEK